MSLKDKYEKNVLLSSTETMSIYEGLLKETNEKVFINKIRLDFDTNGIDRSVMRIVSIMKMLNHINILRLHDVFQAKNQIVLIQEYMSWSLASVLRKRSAIFDNMQLVKSYIYQLLCGVAYMHSCGVIHRNISPESIFLDSKGLLKISNFYYSRFITFPLAKMTLFYTDISYKAPEILLGSQMYDFSSDIWSVGCVILDILCKSVFFSSDSTVSQLYSIFNIFGIPDNYWPKDSSIEKEAFRVDSACGLKSMIPSADPNLVDLVEKMLTIDPCSRITAKRALSHPFFEDISPNLSMIFNCFVKC